MKYRKCSIFFISIFFAGLSMAKEEIDRNYDVDYPTMNQAESGDYSKALFLYEHYALKKGDKEAAKYWLMVAAMSGSSFAKLTFASDFNRQNEFEKNLSKRWIESIDLSNEPNDILARIFSIKGDIYLGGNNKKSVEYYAYAAYLAPDAHKTGLIEVCYKLKYYACVYVWSKYLFSNMGTDKQYFTRLQKMISEAAPKIENIEDLSIYIDKLAGNEGASSRLKLTIAQEVVSGLERIDSSEE